MDIAHAQCKGNGMAVKKIVFSWKPMRTTAKLHRQAKTPSSLNLKNGKDSDEEAKKCFPQDTERQPKWFQQDRSPGTGSKNAYSKSKSTRLRD
jgi:hypothetical protein